MGKLNKLDAANIYDTIGANAPVIKKQEKKVSVKEHQEKEVTTVEVNTEVTAADLLNPMQREKKTGSIFLRCKPSVKSKFDAFCQEKKISQANLFEYWVESLLK